MKAAALLSLLLGLTLNIPCSAEMQQEPIPNCQNSLVRLCGEISLEDEVTPPNTLNSLEQTGLGFTCDHVRNEVVLSVDQASDAWQILVRGDHVLTINGVNPFERAQLLFRSHKSADTISEIKYEHNGSVKTFLCRAKSISEFSPRMQAVYKQSLQNVSIKTSAAIKHERKNLSPRSLIAKLID